MATVKINFYRAGYYFLALALVALAGFWPSYFSTFFSATSKATGYMHFHAVMMTLWITVLVIQPILIKRRQLSAHRAVGKITYVLLPLIFLSVILLAHHRIASIPPEILGVQLFIPFKDLVIIGFFYAVAIRFRRQSAIHARAMIATGLACIEPALVRLVAYAVFPGSQGPEVYYTTLAIIYSIVILLIIRERNQTEGRWVFPSLLGFFVLVHSLAMAGMPISGWDRLVGWFASLPLT